ncbi:glycosyltransferase family 2 protein [Hydrogenophaga sp. IBVHS2]|uniref:glycosyltransferase family 2 protein n=1 Tax=Hydrogenophaga sp. IBVHS2 TaxID=1985170 RepID=UPI0015C51F82|nr:glycosyltransferase family 2 protein [Hydrogenophaga sp. IBVHS2]
MKPAERKTHMQAKKKLQAPSVVILMGTFNGESYILEQLSSIARQTFDRWSLWASDDGSTDGTLEILHRFQAEQSPREIVVLKGPALGFAANFLSMVCNPLVVGDYYAYADQDDIWDADKLERAVRWLNEQDPDVPALYCSSTTLVDSNNKLLGQSPRYRRPAAFKNALVQSIASGNTMVFNQAARAALLAAGADVKVPAHDWWTYLVVSGVGGNVMFDPLPTLRYRQHGSNLIGAGVGWVARIRRLRGMFMSQTRHLHEQNLDALQRIRSLFPPHQIECWDAFAQARQGSIVNRLFALRRSGAYRQTRLSNFTLVLAAVLGKL